MEQISRFILFLTVFLIATTGNSQEIVHKGLISTQLTISPSTGGGATPASFYLHGTLEAYLNRELSFSGEGYYFLGTLSAKDPDFEFNHSIFIGGAYHFIKNNSDLYFGLYPGISITKTKDTVGISSTTKSGVNPLFSTAIGYNFFINKVFHFFIQTRYVIGEHNFDSQQNLSELRFSAGLGFHF